MSKQDLFDICVIGAGASGMSAAITAKKNYPELRVCLLEEKEKVGQKLLATGNGRCNLSNDDLGISHYGGEAEKYSWIFENSVPDEEFFDDLGLVITSDGSGRKYPYSNQAASVLNAFLREIDLLGLQLIQNFKAVRLNTEGKLYSIVSQDGRSVYAASVIIAIGSPAGKHSYAMPELIASTGELFKPFSPALVPIYVYPDVRTMKGARVKAKVQLTHQAITCAEESGEVQFGDGYISGICIMNLSRFVETGKEYELHLNLVSDLLVHEVENYLNVMVQHNVQLSDLLSGLLPKRVGEEIIRACCKDPFRRKASSLNDSEREKVARTLRNWTFKVKSLGPVNLAQISKGGVMELDSQTLASQRNTGLFYCGEVVNVDGECGGYNLHWAWISGQAAGKAACDYLKRVRGAADEV